MAKQFAPIQTRWQNLADTIRKSKDSLEFGDIDVQFTADEQRSENETAMQIEEVAKDMKALAGEMSGYFDNYVAVTIKDGVQEALKDESTYQKLIALLVQEGKLDSGMLVDNASGGSTNTVTASADMLEAEQA